MDISAVLARLDRAISRAGSAVAFAKSAGISPQYLSEVRSRKKPPATKILDALNLEFVVTYREKRPPPEKDCYTDG